MKRSLVLAVLGTFGAGAVSGCNLPDGGDFQGATPTAESVALNVPASGATAQGALTNDGVKRSALLGEVADSYQVTRALTAVVNGGTGFVLVLVKTIVSFPPTSVDADRNAVWGPHSEPLDRNAWRLTVDRVERHVFDWKLDSKDKTLGDDAFVTILSGRHTRATNDRGRPMENYGSGNFTIDWDAAATLPDHNPKEAGQATFTYSRLSPGAVHTINVDFAGVKHEKTGELFDAVYRYTAAPGSGGSMKYGEVRDALPDPGNTGTAPETFTLHSRWMETGAGRSDYQSSGPDITAALMGDGRVSECWDTSFNSQFMSVSYAPASGWGSESSCAFASADFSTVAP
jgi:hypothetical protein